MKNRILIIDDDNYISDLLVRFFNQKGYIAKGAYSGDKGKKMLLKEGFDVVLCDYRLPDSDGTEMLKFIKQKQPGTPVIIMTAYEEIRIAVKLIKLGAYDYVTKPVLPDEIMQLVGKALKSKETPYFQDQNEEFVYGKSPVIQKVIVHCRKVAPTDVVVLIEGETGSGKEYIARLIHNHSHRSKKPFVAVDCGALPKEIANSELFGHIKGSFTGAINDKKGYFEQADGGTLFLDEVGNLSYENQIKLLRALQEKVIFRVGGDKPIKTNIRVIAASNEDLKMLADRNEFREDLFHRLNGFKIHLPPLRKRREDIKEFADYFIQDANNAFNKQVTTISDEAMNLLQKYKWEGNLRELKNTINRAVLLAGSDQITPDLFPEEIIHFKHEPVADDDMYSGDDGIQDLRNATSNKEKELIIDALNQTNNNKSKAAKMLNIDRKTLYNKIKLYDIQSVT